PVHGIGSPCEFPAGTIGGFLQQLYMLWKGRPVNEEQWQLPSDGRKPLAIVVDHGLRDGSELEAAAVADWAEDLGLEAVLRQITWGPMPPPLSQAMVAARRRRYRVLYRACCKHGIGVLLTGHHAGDQAETFLLRFMRASGIDGLAGMLEASVLEPGAPGPLYGMSLPSASSPPLLMLRPLLGVTKSELVRVCEEQGHLWVEDPLNRSNKFARARVRSVLHRYDPAAYVPGARAAAEGGAGSSIIADLVTVGAACDLVRQQQEERVHGLLREVWATPEQRQEADPSGHFADFPLLRVAPFARCEPRVDVRLLTSLLQLVGSKEYPPRQQGVERLASLLRLGQLRATYMVSKCLVSPLLHTKGRFVAIRPIKPEERERRHAFRNLDEPVPPLPKGSTGA
ncbi:unnamed protein product, partial [Ostreobium quekettii]